MSDAAVDAQPSKPFYGTLNDMGEIPPQTGFVVHQVVSMPQGRGTVWAWCKIVEGQPGYADMAFTEPDGVTEPDMSGIRVVLGPVLFKVFC